MPSEEITMNWADAADKENQVQSSWADQVDEEEGIDQIAFPPQSETIDGNIKTVIDYKTNEDGKQVKVVRRYKIETQKTSKAVARRKLLHKFGKSEKDPTGPNKATTFVSENVEMQFISNRPEDLQQEQEDPMLSKLKLQLQYVSFFKTFKSQNAIGGDEEEKKDDAAPAASATTGKYVPPSLRSGGNTAGSSMPNSRSNRDEQATIRVTNLSEETKESDLQELFKPFGPIQRIYLAKDKHTQQSKGFAFINFYNRDDAAKAIKSVCGYGYDHLILNVEWAKPSTPATT